MSDLRARDERRSANADAKRERFDLGHVASLPAPLPCTFGDGLFEAAGVDGGVDGGGADVGVAGDDTGDALESMVRLEGHHGDSDVGDLDLGEEHASEA